MSRWCTIRVKAFGLSGRLASLSRGSLKVDTGRILSHKNVSGHFRKLMYCSEAHITGLWSMINREEAFQTIFLRPTKTQRVGLRVWDPRRVKTLKRQIDTKHCLDSWSGRSFLQTITYCNAETTDLLFSPAGKLGTSVPQVTLNESSSKSMI